MATGIQKPANSILPQNTEQGSHSISKSLLYKNKFLEIYEYKVMARAWNTISGTNRFVVLSIDGLKPNSLENGKLIPFLEVSGKQAALPFIYYQSNKAAKIKASQKARQLFIYIKGDFILNIHTSFVFKIVMLVAKTPVKFEHFDWQNYQHIKKSFKLPD